MTGMLLPILGCLLLAAGTPVPGQTDPHAPHQQEKKPASSSPAKPAAETGHQHPVSEKHERELPSFIPPLTDGDRRAAFPRVEGHAVHDGMVSWFVLFDQLEWQTKSGGDGLSLDSRGWIGRDLDRLWFRAEGDGLGDRVEEAQAHVLYGRHISRWWDVVAGVRQDFRPGPAQIWAAFGIQGLAPYWFEIEATGYVGASGRIHARIEIEYELLLTNRLIVQPLFEAEIVGKSDVERRIGAGLSTTDTGVRLRYELKREVAPYIGITWRRTWGTTADFTRADGENTGAARIVTGIRLWF